jgi:hypothetical protein
MSDVLMPALSGLKDTSNKTRIETISGVKVEYQAERCLKDTSNKTRIETEKRKTHSPQGRVV